MSGEPVLDPDVLAYYDQGRERSRLETSSRLEYERTRELLDRFLPPPPARVLDVGGGAGAYAVPLIESGYDVVLVDPVPLHVDQARKSGVSSAVVGDARSLVFDDDSFDAVLMLGPLYHLTDREDRVCALREAARVVGPSGIVMAAVIWRMRWPRSKRITRGSGRPDDRSAGGHELGAASARAHSGLFAAHLSNARLEVFDGGHMVMFQDRTVYPTIVEFLSA